MCCHRCNVCCWNAIAGVKRWKLYKPLGNFSLPNQSSPNFSEEALGEPVLDTTLRVCMVWVSPIHRRLLNSIHI